MPPKPKYTKEEIVNAAFQLTREKGIDAVVAREVGKRLHTSATPIFTVWDSMEELKEEVRELARQKYRAYMAGIFDYSPAFKEFGMRWVRFAAEEPNLYRLLFLSKQGEESPYAHFRKEFEGILTPLIGEIRKTFGLSEGDAVDLFDRMAVFANGLAAFAITDPAGYSEAQVSQSISQVCLSLVIADKLRDGTLDLSTAKVMAQAAASGDPPRRKVEVRRLERDEWPQALSLAWRVFREYEAPDYPQDGVDEFEKNIHDENYLSQLCLYGAFAGDELLGMLATRENGKHIALFFVDGDHHRQGVGRRLFQAALTACPSNRMTVNAAPFAVPVYHKLGFVDTGADRVENGIRFTPMEIEK